MGGRQSPSTSSLQLVCAFSCICQSHMGQGGRQGQAAREQGLQDAASLRGWGGRGGHAHRCPCPRGWRRNPEHLGADLSSLQGKRQRSRSRGSQLTRGCRTNDSPELADTEDGAEKAPAAVCRHHPPTKQCPKHSWGSGIERFGVQVETGGCSWAHGPPTEPGQMRKCDDGGGARAGPPQGGPLTSDGARAPRLPAAGPAVVLGSQPLVLPTFRMRVRQGAGGLPPACTLGVPEGGGQ